MYLYIAYLEDEETILATGQDTMTLNHQLKNVLSSGFYDTDDLHEHLSVVRMRYELRASGGLKIVSHEVLKVSIEGRIILRDSEDREHTALSFSV